MADKVIEQIQQFVVCDGQLRDALDGPCSSRANGKVDKKTNEKANEKVSPRANEKVRQIVSPNYNLRPTGASKAISKHAAINLLVIHNISLPPGQFGNGYVEQFFQNKLVTKTHPFFKRIAALKVSAHLFICRAGQVTQFVNFKHRAWHAGVSSHLGRDNCNDFSIGIELEGTDELPFTEAQYAALVSVSLALEITYPEITPATTLGHSDIAPGRKTDPGPYFDWHLYKMAWSDSRLNNSVVKKV